MDNLSTACVYPIVLIAGALEAWGPPMNNALKNAPEPLAQQPGLVSANRRILGHLVDVLAAANAFRWAAGRLGGWTAGRLGGWAAGRLGGWAGVDYESAGERPLC